MEMRLFRKVEAMMIILSSKEDRKFDFDNLDN